MKALIIYDCDPDGLLAAATVFEGLGNKRLVIPSNLSSDPSEWIKGPIKNIAFDRAVRYQEPNWENIDKETIVYIVDFAYNSEITKRLCDVAHDVIIIDHHKTTQEEIGNLDFVDFVNLVVYNEQDHSACVNAWTWFNEEKPVPLLHQYVEDMDLWKWKLPDSEEVAAAIACETTDIETFQDLNMRAVLTSGILIDRLKLKGAAILQYQNKTIDILEKQAVLMKIGGHKVHAVNCADPAIVSYLGNRLAQDVVFGATFYLQPNLLWKFSVRSIIGKKNLKGIPVDEIAKKYGGGGHECASGFKVKELFPYEKIESNEAAR